MDKPVSKGNDKMLVNKVRMRKWLLIGGFALGAQALLGIFNHPDSYYYISQLVISFFCIGYGLSMTSQIRKLSDSEGEKK